MRKTSIFSRIISLTLVLLIALTACNKQGETPTPAPEETPEEKRGMDLTGYNVVYEYGTDGALLDKIYTLKGAISSRLGVNVSTKIDINTTETDKEILIGETDRAASADALARLKQQTSKDAYMIEITDSKIVILGTTEKATSRAIAVFTNEYIYQSTEAGLLNIDFGTIYASTYD